tara:strand:+ start:212 stop:2116 length:1905 start_codon:yes stop_codon:yes gene_type:complete
MKFSNIYKHSILIIIPSIIFLFFYINNYLNYNFFFEKNFFRLQLSFLKYLYYYFLLVFFVSFLFLISKRTHYFFNNYYFLFIILSSIIIKFLIHDNNYEFGSYDVKIFLENNKFGVTTYLLYEKISYFLLYHFNSGLSILFYFNVLLGLLSALLVFEISNDLFKNKFTSFFIYLFFLLYLPSSSIETLLRTDLLYNFLLLLSIYVSLKINKNLSIFNLIILLISFILLSACKEQTIYILPLYLIFFFLSKKYLIITLLIITTLVSNTLVKSLNYSDKGVNTSLKNFHLTVKLLQYGYFTKYHYNKILLKANEQEKELLNDIFLNYKNNIFPTKRISNERFDEYNNKNLLHKFLIYAKPYNQSVKLLNKVYLSEKERVLLDNDKSNILKYLSSYNYNKIPKENLDHFLKNYDFFLDKDYFIKKILFKTSKCLDISNEFYNPDCIFENVKKYYNEGIYDDLDNKNYSDTGIFFNFRYKKSSEKIFSSHPSIELISNIIFQNIPLYFSQSMIIFFGDVPRYLNNQIGIGEFIKYKKSNFLKKFLSTFNMIYFPLINFFYIISILNIILIFFAKIDKANKINFIFINIFPFYYGMFLSFSTYNEFARLMVSVAPFQIINFFIFIFLYLKITNLNGLKY